MKRYIYSTQEDIFGMSNVLGRFVKVEKKGLPFSFYYSPCNSSHGPRVKPILNPNKMWLDKAGTLELCDDWTFNPGYDDKHVSDSDVAKMKQFFRKYLVLFMLVWDKQLPDPDLGYYLEGKLELSELLEDITFYEDYKEDMDKIKTVAELEKFCKENDLVNFYGN